MPLIHVLDEPTINQIAAGEVVERPSAVVKELIENAMDAGATAVTAEIKEGGLSFIRITDNGMGIDREDIPLAFMRHATSKIRTAQDLLSVTSLGFRGEALSSVASVAQLELITKTPSALNGYRYIIEGGEEKFLEEIGCPGGTTIIVRNLFYNTPARRKFLKSATTEAGYISDLMERLMVSHPGVSFKYIVNNQVKLQSSGNNSTKDILYQVYGKDISRELLPLEFDSENIKIKGFIGKPIITRGNRNYENYFINGRYIRSNVITKAIEEAYKPFLMQHKYPFVSLYFEINPSFIDVNVHPQKMEIRLKNGEEAYQNTFNTIRGVLSGRELIPRVVLTPQEEAKKKVENIPEPFEENRRKQNGVQQKEKINTVGNFVTSNNMLDMKSDKTSLKTNSFTVNYENGKIVNVKVAETNNDYQVNTDKMNGQDNQAVISNTIPNNLNSYQVSAKTSVSGGTTFNQNATEPNVTGPNAAGLNVAEQNATKQNVTEQNVTKPNAADPNVIKPNATELNAKEQSATNLNTIDAPAEDESLNNNRLADTTVSEPIVNEVQDQTVQSDHNNVQPEILVGTQMGLFAEIGTQSEAPFLSKKAFEEHRIIGQIFSTYWLVEYKKELYIIDQHAAHEKVLYEKIMKAANTKTYVSQQLLPPIVLSLTLREQEVIKKHEEILNSLGYEFEYFGGNEFSVRAVPADLYGISEKELLLEFIDDMAEDIVGNTSRSTSILERVASMSCKAAVKANHTMSHEEAQALIKELLTLDNPYNCPHGRPVIVSMSQYELERKFKRIV